MRTLLLAAVSAALIFMTGCGGGGRSVLPEAEAATGKPLVLAFGDSITAGYIPVGGRLQLRQDLAFTRDLAPVADVVTMAVGGATAAHGVGVQLGSLQGLPADVVIVMFGINDAFSGGTVQQTSDHIDRVLNAYPRARRIVIAEPLWSEQTRAFQAALTEELRVRSLLWGARFLDLYTPSADLKPYCTADRHPCEDWHRSTGALLAQAIR